MKELLAFVHVEKAAGTTVHQIQKRWFGAGYCPVEKWSLEDDAFSADDLRRLRRLYPRLRAIGGHWVKPYGDLERGACPVLWWTLLREPLARCASHYQYQVQRMGKTLSFEEWIADPRYRNFQTKKLVGCGDPEAAARLLAERFVFVGLAERFDESMLMLRRRVAPERPLRWIPENVASGDELKSSLLEDAERRALLAEANRADLELYRYVAEELFPRERAAYGERALAADLERLTRERERLGLDLRRLWSDLWRLLLYKPALRRARRRAARGIGP